MTDAAQIRRCSGAFCAIQVLLPAPDPKIPNRESRTSIRQNASFRPRKLATDPKNTRTSPSILLRLKPAPILCFVRVTDDFNRTHVAIKRPIFDSRKQTPNANPQEKPAVIAISTPQSLFRLERTPIPCFQQLTRILNEPMFRLETIKGGKQKRRRYWGGRRFGMMPHLIFGMRL